MRRWLIVCVLAACERAGDSQNPLGSGEIATGPTGLHAGVIIDASIATLRNDAAPIVDDASAVVADAAVAGADAAVARAPVVARAPAAARDRMSMSEDDAARFADLLIAEANKRRPADDMPRRPPGADLGQAVRDDARNRGGGGRGTRGDGDLRVGGGGGQVGGAGIGSRGPEESGPLGRVSISSTRSSDETALKADHVIQRLKNVYMAGIKRCYKLHLQADPKAKGRVTLALQVTETGSTRNAHATGFSKDVDECIAKSASTWRFPIPKNKDGEPTTTSFEIVLELTPD